MHGYSQLYQLELNVSPTWVISVYRGTLPKVCTDLEQLNVRSSIHDVIFTTLFFFGRLSRIAF